MSLRLAVRNKLFLITKQGILTDGSYLEDTKGGKLNGTSHKGGEIWGQVQRVDVKGILELDGQRIEILGEKFEAPDGDLKGEKGKSCWNLERQSYGERVQGQ